MVRKFLISGIVVLFILAGFSGMVFANENVRIIVLPFEVNSIKDL